MLRNKLNILVAKALLMERGTRIPLDIEYTTEGVPSTGKAIHAMWESAKLGLCTFKVFNGANEAKNLYFTPYVNLLYRLVHDIDHAQAYEIGRGTTKYEDELYLNCSLAVRLYKHTLKYHSTSEALQVFFTFYHDTVGQTKYYAEHKAFCENQKLNTERLLDECEGYTYLKHGQIRLAYAVMLAYMVECGV